MIRLRFRIARPAPTWWNLVKTISQAAVFWTLFLVVVPWLIFSVETFAGVCHFSFPNQAVFAWVGFTLASSLGIWSGVTMAIAGKGTPLPSDTARELVRSGPYRYIRNPMAVAGLAQAACVGIWLGSYGTLFYVFVGMVLWNLAVRPIEEADLQKRFGEDFEQYKRSVRCWIPSFRRHVCEREETSSIRTPAPTADRRSIILFDAVCNLCNASVRFIINRDRTKCFYFASRQSDVGRDLLERHGLDSRQHDTIVLIEGNRAFVRSTAALLIARRLTWPWSMLFGLIVVPRFLRDWIYDWLAANRYRWFGTSDKCTARTDDTKSRFLS
jgi:predicted DCC family thiol-disulfide oxidoreductase YuxK/protein-S-isoprenylcysteine O-methyltransferase Ste14